MIGAVGSVASQIWQAARDVQADSTAPTAFPTRVPGSGTAGSQGAGSAPASGIGADASKFVSDVQSLLLSLQSSGSTGTTAASTNASTDPAAAVQADLATLSQDQGQQVRGQQDQAKVGGGGHHHHHRHAEPAGNDASSTVTQGSATATASSGGGSLDAVIKAIKAYAASNSVGTGGVTV